MILFNLMENLFLYGCSDFYIKKYIMNTNKLHKGSEWRKWDLHIHTKNTNKNDQFSSSNMEEFLYIFFKRAIEKEISAIGVTDYFSIDRYRDVVDYQENIDDKKDGEGKQLFNEDERKYIKNIFLFPNIELRMLPSTDKGRLINIHFIFNPKFVTKLENDFFGELKNQDDFKMNRQGIIDYGKKLKSDITDNDIAYREGINKFALDVKTIKNLLDKNSEIEENSIVIVSNSNNDGASGLQKHYDLFENEDGGLDGVRKTIYEISNAIFSANPKDIKFFLGRKSQGTDGYNNDVYLKDIKEVIDRVGSLKPCLVGSDAHKEDNLFTKFTWIKADLTFEGLKQIIYEPEERVKIQDNKPEEKSGYQVIDRIEIYHQDFQEKKENEETIEEYKTIFLNSNLNTIIGGRSTGKSILLGAIAKKLNSDKEVKLDNTEYSQYIDEIVSSMKIFWKDGNENNTRDIEYFPQSYMYQLAKNSDELNKLVENIITQDINKKTKIAAYQAFSSDNNSVITEYINNLFKAKSAIDSIQKNIKETGDEKGITKEKEKLYKDLEDLKTKIQITEEQRSNYSNLKEEYDKNNHSIQEIEQQKTSLFALKSISIINDITHNLINLTEDIRDKVNIIFSDLKQRYSEEWNEQIQAILLEKEAEVQKIKERNESIEKDEAYLKGLSVFDSNQQYKDIEEKYKRENNKLEKITELKKQKVEYDKHINSLKDSIIENSKKYYTELQQIQDKLSDSSGRLKITATINTDFSKYKNILSGSINQSSSQGKQFVEKLINTTQELFEDMSNMFESLLSDSITLKGGYDNQKLIKELLGTNFFNISYEIEYDTDKFKAMSEGKKAFIILMLLLDFSNKQCPILIDQPEDDLDNRAIYNELVTYIKNKKKERQIIIVTHNSNIVIGADSELVIVSNQQGVNSPNRNNKKFDYIFGSIESSMEKDNTISEILYSQGIRQHICDILEGGETAFKNREKKYGF